jgi:hypothetical protein
VSGELVNPEMHPVTADIPVIFMTALTGTEDKVKGFEAGAVDYVTKPFNPERSFRELGCNSGSPKCAISYCFYWRIRMSRSECEN